MINLARNGSFERWSAGAGPFNTPANGTETADGWFTYNCAAGPGANVFRSGSVSTSGPYSLGITSLGATSFPYVYQNMEVPAVFQGQVVTLHADVFDPSSGAGLDGASISIADGVSIAAGDTATFTYGNAWHHLKVSFVVGSSPAYVQLQLVAGLTTGQTGDVYFDSVYFTVGDTVGAPVPWSAESDELIGQTTEAAQSAVMGVVQGGVSTGHSGAVIPSATLTTGALGFTPQSFSSALYVDYDYSGTDYHVLAVGHATGTAQQGCSGFGYAEGGSDFVVNNLGSTTQIASLSPNALRLYYTVTTFGSTIVLSVGGTLASLAVMKELRWSWLARR